MADLSNLVISITVVGKEKAESDIESVGKKGQKVSDSPVKVRLDTTSIDLALKQLEALKAKAASGALINLKLGSLSEVEAAKKIFTEDLVGAGNKLVISYNQMAEAAKQQKEALKAVGEEEKRRQEIVKQSAAERKAQLLAEKEAEKQTAAERKAQLLAEKEAKKQLTKEQKENARTEKEEARQAAAEQRKREQAEKKAAAIIAQGIKEREKAEATAAKEAAKAQKEAEKAAAAAEKQAGTVKTFNDHLLRTARIAASVAVQFFLLRGAINIFHQLLNTVDEFNTTTIGIASTMTDMAKDQSAPYENFIQNLSYARDMYVQLENAANKFFASGQELIQAWNILTQQGIVLQGTQIDNLGTIVDKIKLLTQGQVSSVQIAQELRAALMGQARPTDQLARIVKDRLGGAWREVFQQVRETQTLDPLAKMFSGLGIARPFIQETLTSQLTTLWTNLRQITRAGMVDPYQDVVNYLKEWNVWLRENKKEVGESLKNAWGSVKFVLGEIEGALSRIKALSADPALMAILGFALGGLRGGTLGAGLGALGGLGIAKGGQGEAFKDWFAGIDKEYEVAKRAKEEGVGFWAAFGYAVRGEWKKAEEAAIKYDRILEEVWVDSKKIGQTKLSQVPTGLAPTESVQRPIVFSDQAVKALEGTSTLVASLEHQLSGVSENSMARIIADIGKMNDQIDKTIYKMKQENDTRALAVLYEQKLKTIRDEIIAQQLEKRNKEIYAFLLEGGPDTLEKGLLKIDKKYEDFYDKYSKPVPQRFMEEVFGGDPILRMVESAKNAEEVMKTSAERWGDTWKRKIAEVVEDIDKLSQKLLSLGKEPKGEPITNYYQRYFPSDENLLQKYFKPQPFAAATSAAEQNMARIEQLGGGPGQWGPIPQFEIVSGREGYRSVRNNNPGNLTRVEGSYQDKYGATWEQGVAVPKFAAFPSMEKGFEALVEQIDRYQKGYLGANLNLAQFVTKYAPPKENNTEEYIQMLEAKIGVGRETPIAQISRDELVRWVMAKESGGEIRARFQGMAGAAEGTLTNRLGTTKEQAAEKNKLYEKDLFILATEIKLNELQKSALSTLASMNIAAEEQNRYAAQALDMEIILDQLKTEQLIKANDLDKIQGGWIGARLRELSALTIEEKKRAEAIQQQVRPMEAQKALLGQYDKYISALGSATPLLSNQLRYQEASLLIQQKIARIELDIWIKQNKHKLSLTEADENRLRVLQEELQVEEKMAQLRKGWAVKGIPGGFKSYMLDAQKELETGLSTATVKVLTDVQEAFAQGFAQSMVDAMNGKQPDIEKLFTDIADKFVYDIYEYIAKSTFQSAIVGIGTLLGVDTTGFIKPDGSNDRPYYVYVKGMAGAAGLSILGGGPGTAGVPVGVGGGPISIGMAIPPDDQMVEDYINMWNYGSETMNGSMEDYAIMFDNSNANLVNTAYGYDAMFANSNAGLYNTAIGYNSMFNSAIGGLTSWANGLAGILGNLLSGGKGGSIGGVFSSIIGGLFGGGMSLSEASSAGQGTYSAFNVSGFGSDALFSLIRHQGGRLGIPYAHQGLKLAADEVPFIGLTGERVLSRQETRDYESSKQETKPTVNVTVIDNSSKTQTNVEQNAQGDLVITIDELTAQAYNRRGLLYKSINTGSQLVRR